MLMYVSLSCTLVTSSFFPFLYTVENSTVTLYGRGFVKFNVAVWCGFSYNDTYRLGKYVFCHPCDSQSGQNKINIHLRHVQSVTVYFITQLIINLELNYCTKNT